MDKKTIKIVEKLILDEMTIAHTYGQPTSRLTSLIVKLRAKEKEEELKCGK